MEPWHQTLRAVTEGWAATVPRWRRWNLGDLLAQPGSLDMFWIRQRTVASASLVLLQGPQMHRLSECQAQSEHWGQEGPSSLALARWQDHSRIMETAEDGGKDSGELQQSVKLPAPDPHLCGLEQFASLL